jgi:hypothetical protein
VRFEGQDPVSRRQRWIAFLTSIAVHSLLFLVVIQGRLPDLRERTARPILIPLPAPEPLRTTPTPYYAPYQEQGEGIRRMPLPPPNPQPEEPQAPPVPAVSAPQPAETGGVRRSPAGRLGPALGDGRLWVRPLPLPPRELAQRLQPDHAVLVDSAVTAIVQGYLDSIAREPGADQVRLPDWTTKVAGLKFGLDSRYAYIAGLKIPAAVLALLPLPAGGNQQQALNHNAEWIAEDLRRAAQRAQTLDDFKRAVRELREEKQRQKELERAQRENPDSSERKPE